MSLGLIVNNWVHLCRHTLTKAEILYKRYVMRHANPTLWYQCIFGHPPTYSDLFSMRNPARVIKFRIHPSNSYLLELLHGAIHFVAFADHICSCTYGITLIHLHVFHFLLHNAYHLYGILALGISMIYSASLRNLSATVTKLVIYQLIVQFD